MPAELQHLLEEIEAKDKVVTECRKEIQQRDISIQKHLKAGGMSAPNPKETGYVKTALEQYDKAQGIQEEKVALSEKARVLLDRHIKRFDQQIKQLEQTGILPPDPLMPSLLHQSPGNRLPPLSATTTGSSTPLHPIAGNASNLPSAAITNTAIARLVSQQTQHPRGNTPAAATGAATPPASGNSASQAARSQRESSIDAKRRRLNAPATSSGLRQSSLGPSGSTPKASTPTGRAGSAGPRATGNKKKDSSTKSGLTPAAAGVGRLNPAVKKGSRRKGGRKKGATQSDTGEDSALSEMDGSESERASTKGEGGSQRARAQGGLDGTHVVDEDDEEGADGDDKKYCTCRSVSYGNMVACDNEECEYEWFHWSCVGMTREPAGKWYCEDCKQKLGLK